jgi:hypothetical protein
MWVRLDNVSKLIILNGSITLDGVEYTDEVDCREIDGDHELTVNGEFDFRPMTQSDRDYVIALKQEKIREEKDEEILNLQAEVVELEYQKALEVMTNV